LVLGEHMDLIEIFTGNRAEFGILFPLIKEFSRGYRVNLIVSGAHLLKKWHTLDEIENKLKLLDTKENINIVKLPIAEQDDTLFSYSQTLSEINRSYVEYRRELEDNVKFCFFLGDRIETVAFAISALYLENILVHVCGGDVANIPAFDTTARHGITQISHIHLVTNQDSQGVLKQLGEEDWRVSTIGMLSLDYVFYDDFVSKEALREKYGIKGDNLVIATYHPDQYYSSEFNFNNFKKMIDGLEQLDCEVILTYPNNDPGYMKIIEYIEGAVAENGKINVVKNLGSMNYLGLLHHFNSIMVGNSSGLLTESSFFSAPALMTGRRQIDRLRGKNVTELFEFTSRDIVDFVNNAIDNFDELKESFKDTKYIYGDGVSGDKSFSFINNIFETKTRMEIINKKFVRL
jgi:UDP-hydrolysing UDP-N-acetyl-D-glucosamine 2-epimerase